MAGSDEAQMPTTARLWRYQAERFPLLRNGALIAVFAASGVTLSAVLAHRALPQISAYACAFLVTLGLFWQLRVADEVKDAQDDARFRPERPVPRGLVSLRLLIGTAWCIAAIQAAVCLALAPGLLGLLCVVWAWMALMAAEFGAPERLRARPAMYLVSHMLVMPLIDLWITSVEWWPAQGRPPLGLIPVLLLSFANGCVLEIGRKTWAPDSERPGVDSYSAQWGTRQAAAWWLAVLACAWAMAVAAGVAAGAPTLGILLLLPFAVTGWAGLAFCRRPDLRAQRRLDTLAGLWVLASYAGLGAWPLLLRHGS